MVQLPQRSGEQPQELATKTRSRVVQRQRASCVSGMKNKDSQTGTYKKKMIINKQREKDKFNKYRKYGNTKKYKLKK